MRLRRKVGSRRGHGGQHHGAGGVRNGPQPPALAAFWPINCILHRNRSQSQNAVNQQAKQHDGKKNSVSSERERTTETLLFLTLATCRKQNPCWQTRKESKEEDASPSVLSRFMSQYYFYSLCLKINERRVKLRDNHTGFRSVEVNYNHNLKYLQ